MPFEGISSKYQSLLLVPLHSHLRINQRVTSSQPSDCLFVRRKRAYYLIVRFFTWTQPQRLKLWTSRPWSVCPRRPSLANDHSCGCFCSLSISTSASCDQWQQTGRQRYSTLVGSDYEPILHASTHACSQTSAVISSYVSHQVSERHIHLHPHLFCDILTFWAAWAFRLISFWSHQLCKMILNGHLDRLCCHWLPLMMIIEGRWSPRHHIYISNSHNYICQISIFFAFHNV